VNGYSIDPQSLRQAASALDAAGERLTSEWNGLVGTVEGMGEPWGGGDIGTLIGISYQAVQSVADESFTSAAEDLSGFADKLTAVADNHERNERETTADISSISVPSSGR
jgi:hypothetical protein